MSSFCIKTRSCKSWTESASYWQVQSSPAKERPRRNRGSHLCACAHSCHRIPERTARPRPDAVPGRHCPDLFRSTCSSAEGTHKRLRENCRGVCVGEEGVGGRLKSKQRNWTRTGKAFFRAWRLLLPNGRWTARSTLMEASEQLVFSGAWMATKPRRELWLVRGHISHFTGSLEKNTGRVRQLCC